MQPPRLESARLIFDAHRREDFEDFAAMWADPEVVRHISGKASTRQESWFRFMRGRGSWPIVGYGPWVIRDKLSGRFVGEIGFADFQRKIEPPVGTIPEAGWILARWAHGQGFATEALAAAVGWLQSQNKYPQVYCVTTGENAASIRVAEKNGFLSAGTVLMDAKPLLMLTRKL